MQIAKQHQPRESVMVSGAHFRNDEVITGDLSYFWLAQNLSGIRHAEDCRPLLPEGLTE